MRKVLFLALLAVLGFASVLEAQVPKLINVQGNLLDDAGTPLNEQVLITVEIYDAATGNDPAIWSDVFDVDVTQGYFSINLGSGIEELDIDFDTQYYIQFRVGNQDPSERVPLTSSAYALYTENATNAMNAEVATTVVDGAITQDKLAPGVQAIPTGPAGGALSGTYPNPDIRSEVIIDAIEDGSITQEKLAPNVTTPPSGPAGGDLTGTYPAPLIAEQAVTTDKLDDEAVTTAKIKDRTIEGIDIRIGTITADELNSSGVTAGTYGSDIWTSTFTVDEDGRITDAGSVFINVDDDGTNSDITISGTSSNDLDLQINADAVGTTEIADDAVTVAKILTTDEASTMTNGYVLKYNDGTGMNWEAPTVNTSEFLITGNGLDSDRIRMNETLPANDRVVAMLGGSWTYTEVTSAMIDDETIVNEDIADGTIDATAKVAPSSSSLTALVTDANGNVAWALPAVNVNTASSPLEGNGTATDAIRIASSNLPSGYVMASDGNGGAEWVNDPLALDYAGSYSGTVTAFTITHSGSAGNVGNFVQDNNTNESAALRASSNSNSGTGTAFLATGDPDNGNYVAYVTTQSTTGRAMLIEGNSVSPYAAGVTTDPTDSDEAVLVVRNLSAGNANNPIAGAAGKTAIKTYGDIWANSAVGGESIVAESQVIIGTGATSVTITPPANVGDPLNFSDDVEIGEMGNSASLTVWGDIYTPNNIYGNSGSFNTISASSVTFTDLEVDNLTVNTSATMASAMLNAGTSVTEFSTDGTLADNSDDAIPTEQAVKTYVDNQTKDANNGLTNNSNTFQLGGNLNQNTTISDNGFTLTIDGTASTNINNDLNVGDDAIVTIGSGASTGSVSIDNDGTTPALVVTGTANTTAFDVTGNVNVTGTITSIDVNTTNLSASTTATLASVDIAGGEIDGTAIGANNASTGAFTTVTATDVNTTNLSASTTATLASVDIAGGEIDGTAIGANNASTGAFTTVTATDVNTTNLSASTTATLASVDIAGGEIDGTAIGANNASTGAFTTVTATDVNTTNLSASTTATLASVDIAGGEIDGTAIGANNASTGAFTTVTATDVNTTNLSASTTATLASVDIAGGEIDGTAIGANNASTGAFTTLTATSLDMTNSATIILDDDTMAADDENALATQQSIKAYVDAQSTDADNGLTENSGTIQLGGDLNQATSITNDGNVLAITGSAGSTSFAANGDVTIDEDLTVSTDLTVEGNISDAGGDLTLDDDVVVTGSVNVTSASTFQSGVALTGGFLSLPSGVAIDEISTNVNLGGNDDVVPTQNAVMSYVDNQNETVANGLTETSNVIRLGGSLTANTTITNAGSWLAIAGGTNSTTFTSDGDLGLGGDINVAGQVNSSNATPFVFEGATNDANETSIVVADPTTDQTLTVPNSSGTFAVFASTNEFEHELTIDNSSDNHALTIDQNDSDKKGLVVSSDNITTTNLVDFSLNVASTQDVVSITSNATDKMLLVSNSDQEMDQSTDYAAKFSGDLVNVDASIVKIELFDGNVDFQNNVGIGLHIDDAFVNGATNSASTITAIKMDIGHIANSVTTVANNTAYDLSALGNYGVIIVNETDDDTDEIDNLPTNARNGQELKIVNNGSNDIVLTGSVDYAGPACIIGDGEGRTLIFYGGSWYLMSAD